MVNRLYYYLLLNGAVFLDDFGPAFLQNFVRFSYDVPVTKVLEQTTRLRLKNPKMALISRHSSRTGEGFNVLLSDLDLSAYLESPDEEKIKKIRNHISLWKRYLPFIGELEIYNMDEKERRDRLLETAHPYFTVLRQIRKIQWMETAYSQAPTEYHRYKARRAIQRCLDGISTGMKALPQGNLGLISDPLETWILKQTQFVEINPTILKNLNGISVFSYYMGGEITFGGGNPSKNLGYVLSPQAALLLLSMVPNGIFENKEKELTQAIDGLRKRYSFIRNIWGALSELELIIVRGVTRAHAEEMPWAGPALTCLHEALAQFQAMKSLDS